MLWMLSLSPSSNKNHSELRCSFFISCSVFLVSYSLHFSTLMMFFFLLSMWSKWPAQQEAMEKHLYHWRRTVRHRSSILYVYLYIRTNIFFSVHLKYSKEHGEKSTWIEQRHRILFIFSFFSFYSLFFVLVSLFIFFLRSLVPKLMFHNAFFSFVCLVSR